MEQFPCTTPTFSPDLGADISVAEHGSFVTFGGFVTFYHFKASQLQQVSEYINYLVNKKFKHENKN